MSKIAAVVVYLAVVVGSSLGNRSNAAEPGWSPVIIATGEYRNQIKSIPVEQRPYRPFHFYGNTIRRNHYRGNPLAMPKDLSTTAGQLIAPR